jgi:Domain of unknown function (DUF4157)/Microbial transglutaminase
MGGFAGKDVHTQAQGTTTGAAQHSPGKSTLVEQVYGPGEAVQRKAENDSKDVHATAEAGASGPGGKLPHLDLIQRSFGGHDVSGVRAHTDSGAAAANAEMGSRAYARGNDVAFGGAPDLHTAAHEAAHVVQQRAGVHLKGGVGEQGDSYERHADAVADTVVAGGSAESLLSTMAGSPGSDGKTADAPVQHALQFIGTPLDKKPPAGEPVPTYGEDKGVQRRFSPEQYIAMWEKEQGRKMTPDERDTISRGCIGITAMNLHGGGNPLASAEKKYATFELAHKYMVDHNKLLDDAAKKPGSTVGPARYVLFASLFWSNQSDDYNERLKHDDKAFLPDPKTGEIDMTGYKYRAQSRIKKDAKTGAETRTSYINFDYGFWDESSQCFWHANHKQHKDPAKAAADPMKVLQSTKEKFVKGYFDFDRIVFCVALAHNYNPGLAAMTHVGSN